MQILNLPKTNLKITHRGGKAMVFDVLRRKFVALSPEEWVRQHFIHFLIHFKGYPAARMNNEILVLLNGTRKRCDSVLYNEFAEPILMIEYKRPEVKITQEVFDQISRYNIEMKVRWLIVSNGLQHFCCYVNYEEGTYHFLPDIPDFKDLDTPIASPSHGG